MPDRLPDPDQPESLGLTLYLWESPQGYSFSRQKFVPLWSIVVPSNWRLVPDPTHGVVLVNVWGERISATEALDRAEKRRDGFRVCDGDLNERE